MGCTSQADQSNAIQVAKTFRSSYGTFETLSVTKNVGTNSKASLCLSNDDGRSAISMALFSMDESFDSDEE